MMCLFVACFAFSMGPIKWVVMSEIFPTRIRGRAMAIATLAVWITDGIYNQLFPMVRESLGVPGSFFIFAESWCRSSSSCGRSCPKRRGGHWRRSNALGRHRPAGFLENGLH